MHSTDSDAIIIMYHIYGLNRAFQNNKLLANTFLYYEQVIFFVIIQLKVDEYLWYRTIEYR